MALRPSCRVPTIADWLVADGDAWPRAVAVWGDPGAGKSTALGDLARLARGRGFVPVAIHVLEQPEFRPLLAGRTLFLIADDTASGWSALVAATLRVPKSHILISAGDGEVAGIDGLPMPRVRPDALASAVRPAAQGVAIAKRIHRASRRAHGLPGRFVGLLWPQAAVKKWYMVRHRPILRAAEQPATYGAEDSNEAHAAICRVEREAWPAPAELSALRKRMESARRLIDRGRHAPGERLLRQAIGGFARRGMRGTV